MTEKQSKLLFWDKSKTESKQAFMVSVQNDYEHSITFLFCLCVLQMMLTSSK